MNDTFQVGHAGWSPDYDSNKPRQINTVKSNRMPRLVRLLRDSYPSNEQGKIEDEISDSLDMASNETLAELLRDPTVCTRRLYDGLLREAVARLLLPNSKITGA